MEIIHVTAECYPVAKAGGLGDVAGALPKYLNKAGHNAKVIMPMYRTKFLLNNDWDVVQLKRAMIDSAKKTVCLTISEKLNTQQPLKVCSLDKIDILITELLPDDPLLKTYKEAGITVI